jgi:hypothetical protein
LFRGKSTPAKRAMKLLLTLPLLVPLVFKNHSNDTTPTNDFALIKDGFH